MTIDIPPNEIRKFKSGILPNKLKYVVIEDTSDDMSHISMAINIGSLSEPIEYMGLAHFLEHMLFLGSNKYDKESYFEEVLKMNGGSCNAYTGVNETVYFFDILNNNIEEVLDIFSRFFIDPLFNESSVEREINAINSEHLKNINNDFWFGRQVIYNESKKDSSIYQRFTTGTLETLKSHNIKQLRDEMISFYKLYYHPDNMGLVIQSNNIDQTEKLIIKYFSEIEPKIPTVPMKNDITKFITGQEYVVIPSNNINEIIYFWDVPTFNTYIGNHAIDVLNDIIEFNGINNLRYVLKREGLASGLDCIYLEEGIYIIKITMCCQCNKQSLERINGIIHYYIDFIQDNTNISWDAIYQYMEDKYNLNYLYDTKLNNNDLVSRIAVNIHSYSMENVYKGSITILNQDINILYDLIKRIQFKNVSIIYFTKNTLYNNIRFTTDKYYLRKYGLLPTSFIKKKIPCNFEVKMDKDTLDIKPTIVKNLDKYNIPQLVGKRLWYGASDTFNEPYVYGIVYLSNERLFNTLKDYILTLISYSIINQYIAEIYSQQFELGYSVQFSSSNTDALLMLSITGLNYRYTDFFNKVIEDIKKIKPEEIILKNTVDKIQENISNINNRTPWEYADYIIGLKKNKYSYTNDKMKRMIHRIMKGDYMKTIGRRIKRITHMYELATTSIIYGNINKKDIPKIESKYTPSKIPIPRQLKSISIKHPNKDEMNKLVMMVLNCGKFTPYNTAIYLILSLLLEQPSYQQLRTKYQLGYLVNSSLQYDNLNYYITIKVQSALEVNLIEEKMREFIEWFRLSYLEDKTINDTFSKTKEAAIGLLLSKPINMVELMNKYIGEIKNRTYLFDKNTLIAKQINRIRLNHVKELYREITQNITMIKIY